MTAGQGRTESVESKGIQEKENRTNSAICCGWGAYPRRNREEEGTRNIHDIRSHLLLGEATGVLLFLLVKGKKRTNRTGFLRTIA